MILVLSSMLMTALLSSSVWAQDEEPDETSEETPADATDDSAADDPFGEASTEASDAEEESPPTVRGSSREDGSTAAANASSRSGMGSDYDLRLRELEDRVNELKESIYRSKSRLVLLREQILQENIGGSRAVIVHRNRIGAAFSVERVVYGLDGQPLFTATSNDTDLGDSQELYNGSVLPGQHNLSIQVELRGNPHGVFSYMEGFEFTVRSSRAFVIEEGQTLELDVILDEEGGANTPLEDRPVINFEEDYYQTTVSDADAEEDGAE